MKQPTRILTIENVEDLTNQFLSELGEIGRSIQGKTGFDLLRSLKRDALDHGPYERVSLFEAANRALSDLVILRGVHWLLKYRGLPFDRYTVEFGNEDNNGFDLRASSNGEELVGEAFNVANSFFQCKKGLSLKKLRENGVDADYKLLLFNSDAVSADYRPRVEDGVVVVSIDVVSGDGQFLSEYVTRK